MVCGAQMQENICANDAGSELCLHIRAVITTPASVQLLLAQKSCSSHSAAEIISTPSPQHHPGVWPEKNKLQVVNLLKIPALTLHKPAWPPLVVVFHCHHKWKISTFGGFKSYTAPRVSDTTLGEVFQLLTRRNLLKMLHIQPQVLKDPPPQGLPTLHSSILPGTLSQFTESIPIQKAKSTFCQLQENSMS